MKKIILSIVLLFGCNNVPETPDKLKDYLVNNVWVMDNGRETKYDLYFIDDSTYKIVPHWSEYALSEYSNIPDTIFAKYRVIKKKLPFDNAYAVTVETEPKLVIVGDHYNSSIQDFNDPIDYEDYRAKEWLYFDNDSLTLVHFSQNPIQKIRSGQRNPTWIKSPARPYYSYFKKMKGK